MKRNYTLILHVIFIKEKKRKKEEINKLKHPLYIEKI